MSFSHGIQISFRRLQLAVTVTLTPGTRIGPTHLSPMIPAHNITLPTCCWCRKCWWRSSLKYTQPFDQMSGLSRVVLVSSVNKTQLISNIMYFWAHLSYKILWLGIKKDSFQGAHMEAMVLMMQFLVVFCKCGSPAVVKIALLVCPGFPRNLPLILLKSHAVTISQWDRFFHGESYLKKCLTISTWWTKFSAMVWREEPLILFFMMIDFPSLLKPSLCLIVLRKKKSY